MNRNNNDSRIILYLSGLMSKEETEAFESEMASSPELTKDVYLYRTAQLKQFADLKNRLKKDSSTKQIDMVPSRWRPMRVAAAILLVSLLGTGTWFGLNKYQAYQAEKQREKEADDSLQKIGGVVLPQITKTHKRSKIEFDPQTDELVNSNIADSKQPIANLPAELNALVLQYERAQSASDYQTVAQKLRVKSLSSAHASAPDEYGGAVSDNNTKTIKENTNIASYRALYHGLSLLALAKYDTALQQFTLIQIPELANEAQWYKTLTYLKKGDTTRSIELLQSIINSNSKFKAPAQELLDSINKNNAE